MIPGILVGTAVKSSLVSRERGVVKYSAVVSISLVQSQFI